MGALMVRSVAQRRVSNHEGEMALRVPGAVQHERSE